MAHGEIFLKKINKNFFLAKLFRFFESYLENIFEEILKAVLRAESMASLLYFGEGRYRSVLQIAGGGGGGEYNVRHGAYTTFLALANKCGRSAIWRRCPARGKIFTFWISVEEKDRRLPGVMREMEGLLISCPLWRIWIILRLKICNKIHFSFLRKFDRYHKF